MIKIVCCLVKSHYCLQSFHHCSLCSVHPAKQRTNLSRLSWQVQTFLDTSSCLIFSNTLDVHYIIKHYSAPSLLDISSTKASPEINRVFGGDATITGTKWEKRALLIHAYSVTFSLSWLSAWLSGQNCFFSFWRKWLFRLFIQFNFKRINWWKLYEKIPSWSW